MAPVCLPALDALWVRHLAALPRVDARAGRWLPDPRPAQSPLPDPQLAAFQAALLEAPERNALRADPAAAPFREYLDEPEPRMLEVAAELLQKWGRRIP